MPRLRAEQQPPLEVGPMLSLWTQSHFFVYIAPCPPHFSVVLLGPYWHLRWRHLIDIKEFHTWQMLKNNLFNKCTNEEPNFKNILVDNPQIYFQSGSESSYFFYCQLYRYIKVYFQIDAQHLKSSWYWGSFKSTNVHSPLNYGTYLVHKFDWEAC